MNPLHISPYLQKAAREQRDRVRREYADAARAMAELAIQFAQEGLGDLAAGICRGMP